MFGNGRSNLASCGLSWRLLIKDMSEVIHPKLQHAADAVEQQLAEMRLLLLDVLDDTRSRLFAEADGCDAETGRSRYFDANRLLKTEEEAIAERFLDALKASRPGAAAAVNDLQVTQSILTLAELRYRHYRVQLLNQARNQGIPAENFHYLWPGHLAVAFDAAIRPLELEEDVHLLLWHGFERFFLSQLEYFFESVLFWLESDEDGFFDSSAAAGKGRGKKKSSVRESAVLRDMADALLSIQDRATAGMPAYRWRPVEYTRHLQEGLLKQHPQVRFDAGVHERIDRINALFSSYYADDSLNETAKALIARLQLPIIRAGLMDEEVITHPLHPVRRVLTEFVALTTNVQDRETDYYLGLEKITNQILVGFRHDLGQFDQTLDGLRRLNESTREAYMRESLAVARKRHDQVLKKTREYVLRELRGHVLGHFIPESLRPLVDEAMAQLLQVRYIRFGGGSVQWREAIDLLDMLVSSIQPGMPGETSQERFKLSRQVVRNTREYLKQVIPDPRRVHALVKALQEEHARIILDIENAERRVLGDEGCIESPASLEQLMAAKAGTSAQNTSSPGPAAESSPPPRADQDELPAAQVASARADSADTPAIPVVEHLPPAAVAEGMNEDVVVVFLADVIRKGEWFRLFMGRDRAPRRLKAHGYDAEKARVSFADRNLDKVLEMDAGSLALDLLEGRSAPLYSDYRYAQALERFREALRHQRSA